MDEQDLKQIAQESFDPTWPKAGEVYRHYKDGLYTVMAVAVHEEELTPFVVYRSQVHGTVWLRTPANWLQTVHVDGQEVPRFARVKEGG